MPLHRFVARFFEHERVREAFSFHSLFIGGDPYRVPAIYGALVYLQLRDGGWYADGGVYSLVEAMARPLDVRCGSPVERIEVAGGRVRGVALRGGERVPADVVVSNADVLRIDALLGRRRAAAAARRPCRCFLLYLGTDRVFESLRHHTLLVGDGLPRLHPRGDARARAAVVLLDLRPRARADRAGDGDRGRRLAGDPAAGPEPARATSTGSEAADGLRDASSRTSSRTFGLTGLGASVRVEHRMTPVDFARDLGAVDGQRVRDRADAAPVGLLPAPNRDRRVRRALPRRRRDTPGRRDPRRADGRGGDGRADAARRRGGR